MEPPSLRDRVQRSMRLHRGRGVVVGVSGGSDSVGLLRLLNDLRESLALRLVVAHLDHGARGEESRADAGFVAGLAEALGLAFELGRWRPGRTSHFEADARAARYAWLSQVAHEHRCDRVAVGHTRDDQAETVLHRILRGTGPRGLAGIPPRRPLAPGVVLIRPLLGIGREEIRAALSQRGQPFREDASNSDLARTRNRIRHDLLPKLARDYNPRAAESLARLARHVRAARSWESHVALHLEATLAAMGDGEIALRTEALWELPLGLKAEVVRAAWRRAGWPERGMTARRWLRLADAIGGDAGAFSAGAGVMARPGAQVFTLTRGDVASPAHAPVALPIPGVATWGATRLTASVNERADSDSPGATEMLDLDRLQAAGSLTVRAPIAGDRFDPLGMGGRTQTLNDFFRGRDVPLAARAGVPLVCDDAGIVWVVGHRIAERVKRDAATRRVLTLRAEADGPSPSPAGRGTAAQRPG